MERKFPCKFSESVPRRLLDLDKIADSGQVFRWKKDGDAYIAPVMGYHARFSQDDDMLLVEHDGPDDSFWRTHLDLDRDYAVLIERFASLGSPLVNRSLEIAAGIRNPQQPFFETAVTGIATQNNNIGKITRSITRLCGDSDDFPDAATILERLDGDSFSLGYRVEYIQDFCTAYLAGRFSDIEDMCPLVRASRGLFPMKSRPPYEETEKRLREQRGIGPKVAALIALFSLGYTDAIPRDVWIRRAEAEGVIWDREYAGLEQQFIFYAAVHGAVRGK